MSFTAHLCVDVSRTAGMRLLDTYERIELIKVNSTSKYHWNNEILYVSFNAVYYCIKWKFIENLLQIYNRVHEGKENWNEKIETPRDLGDFTM